MYVKTYRPDVPATVDLELTEDEARVILALLQGHPWNEVRDHLFPDADKPWLEGGVFMNGMYSKLAAGMREGDIPALEIPRQSYL